MPVVTSTTPTVDGCPILTRLNAFIVDQGVPATLQQVFRDSQGNVIVLPTDDSDSDDSDSDSDSLGISVSLKIAEFTGLNDAVTPRRVYTVTGTVANADEGETQAVLPADIYNSAGIYTLSWAFLENGVPIYVSNAILSVERSLFGSIQQHHNNGGAPTVTELRMEIMDSSGAENSLLDAVEFTDEQFLLAIARPIEYFNSTNPPVSQSFTTRTFPWRHPWVQGILAQLHRMAAANYRRNRLAVNAGGLTIDDKNREQEYLRAAKMYDDEWRNFVLNKKAQISALDWVGGLGSSYGCGW